MKKTLEIITKSNDPRNYCKQEIMSHCTAGETWANQKKCKYSRRSDTRDECMYYNKDIDGHCDCLKAQKDKTLV